jgi:glycosyltransferase involved in cell wall biosynthesis
MAANLPVITTPAGDAARIVVDSQTGFVTPFDDPSALAEKIVTLSGAPELGRRLGKAGRSRVVREFGFPQFSARLFQMYAAMARQLGQRRLVALLESLPGPAEGASPSLSVSRSEVPAS